MIILIPVGLFLVMFLLVCGTFARTGRILRELDRIKEKPGLSDEGQVPLPPFEGRESSFAEEADAERTVRDPALETWSFFAPIPFQSFESKSNPEENRHSVKDEDRSSAEPVKGEGEGAESDN